MSTAATQQEVSVDLKGSKLESKGTVVTLTSPNLTDENSFAAPKKIIPTEKEYKLKGDKAPMGLPPYSVVVLKLKMK